VNLRPIATTSALALGLALSSLPAQAQKKDTTCASTPGGCSNLNTVHTATAMTTVQVIESVTSGPKTGASNNAPLTFTYALNVPTNTTFSGPVRLCLQYNSGTTSANAAANKLNSALMSVLSQVKDRTGKSGYRVAPGSSLEDDKRNSQMCAHLTDGRPF
jgi:hypothetical protein